MNVELHLLVNGVDRGPLPSYQSLQLSPVFCDIGTISFKYPRSGKKYKLIDGLDELEIVPWIDGVAQPRLGGYVNQISGDDVAEASIIDYAGQMYLRRLDEIRVYPRNWPGFDPTAPSYQFTSNTGGYIIQALIQAAQNRGTATDIDISTFSQTVDSKGQPWAKTITLEVKPGATVLDVIQSLHDNAMIEFEMVGKSLRVYNIDTYTTDRTTGTKPLTFRKGRDLSDSPRKVSSRDVATVMLAAGKDDAGLYHEEVDPTAVAGRRRIEGYVSNGNVIDAGTLESFTEASLQKTAYPTMEKTHGLAYSNPKTPRPLEHFDVGDWVFSDTGNGRPLERLRVKQWVIAVNDKGVASGSVTLNDLIAEQNVKLLRRINGIVGGGTITGESKAQDAVPTDLVDTLSPATPAGLALASAPFTDDHGVTWAQVTASWAQVTTNADGSPVTDLAGYILRWRYSAANTTDWHIVSAPGNGTTVMWSPVGANASITAQIQSYDKVGNLSSWSTNVVITTQDDTTPPEQPSTPVVDNYLGLLRAYYNGKTKSGAAWAPDVMQIQVHQSNTNNFTPTAATWVDTLTDAGYSYIENPYDTTVYVKFVAQDRNGNLSTPSLQASGTTSRILSDDIFAGAVGTAQLADLAVTTAKINNLAVNSAQIGSLDVGKLAAGIMNAQITISGRIATALTGKRMELNAVGLQGWDAGGNLTVNVDGVSNLMMGTLKTALTGRRIEISAGGNSGEVTFYGPVGQVGKVTGFSAAVSGWGSETIAMQYPISATAESWNSITIRSDERAYFSSGFVGAYVGGDGPGTKGFQISWAINRGSPTAGFNTGYTRFQIDSATTQILDPYQNLLGYFANNFTRFPTYTTAAFAGGNGGWLQLNPTTNNTQSPQMWLSGDGTYGSYVYTLGNPAEWNFVAGSGSVWCPTRASAFNVASDESLKTAVKPLKGSARDKLAPMAAHTYRVNHKGARRQLGFMAHTAPEEIRVPTPPEHDGPQGEAIDLYGLTALGIEYIKEVDAELEQLRAELLELKELVKK